MVNRRRLMHVLAFTLGVASTRDARAQVEHPLSVDGAVGLASVDSREFLNLGKAVAHLALTDRLVQRGRFAVTAEVGYDWLGEFFLIGANPDLICERALRAPVVRLLSLTLQGRVCRSDWCSLSPRASKLGPAWVAQHIR